MSINATSCKNENYLNSLQVIVKRPSTVPHSGEYSAGLSVHLAGLCGDREVPCKGRDTVIASADFKAAEPALWPGNREDNCHPRIPQGNWCEAVTRAKGAQDAFEKSFLKSASFQKEVPSFFEAESPGQGAISHQSEALRLAETAWASDLVLCRELDMSCPSTHLSSFLRLKSFMQSTWQGMSQRWPTLRLMGFATPRLSWQLLRGDLTLGLRRNAMLSVGASKGPMTRWLLAGSDSGQSCAKLCVEDISRWHLSTPVPWGRQWHSSRPKVPPRTGPLCQTLLAWPSVGFCNVPIVPSRRWKIRAQRHREIAEAFAVRERWIRVQIRLQRLRATWPCSVDTSAERVDSLRLRGTLGHSK